MVRFLMVLMVVMVAPVWADGVLISRVELKGSAPYYTEAVLSKVGEFWLYGAGSEDYILEPGKLVSVPVGKNQVCLAGGYLSWWNGPKKLFAEPFVYYSREVNKVSIVTKLYAYIPLNGGNLGLGFDEISLNYRVDNDMKVGLTTYVWNEDQATTFKYGPQVSIVRGKCSFNLRYLTGGDQDIFRFQMAQAF